MCKTCIFKLYSKESWFFIVPSHWESDAKEHCRYFVLYKRLYNRPCQKNAIYFVFIISRNGTTWKDICNLFVVQFWSYIISAQMERRSMLPCSQMYVSQNVQMVHIWRRTHLYISLEKVWTFEFPKFPDYLCLFSCLYWAK